MKCILTSGGGEESTRRHEIRLYETDDGLHVVVVSYATICAGERDHYAAKVCATPADVAEYLRNVDPLARLADHPKRKLIEQQLVSQYEQAVAAVLADDLPRFPGNEHRSPTHNHRS